jgi:hypothetical protein
VFNVKEYGAKGDGVTNDAPAFASAFTAANTAGGGVVLAPAGTYLVNSTLAIPDAVELVGEGKEATTIKLGNSKNVPILRTVRFGQGGAEGGAMGFAVRNI